MLNEIQGRLQRRDLRYWRNKHGAEVDFVLPQRGEKGPVAIEAKWSAGSFDPAGLMAFRRIYPQGPSFVVAPDVDTLLHPLLRGFRGRVRLVGRADRQAPMTHWQCLLLPGCYSLCLATSFNCASGT